MKFNRRRLFAAFAGAASAGAAVPATAREAAPALGRAEINATALGVRPNLEVDQSAALQHAIEQAAAAGAVLRMPPGLYRAGALQLPPCHDRRPIAVVVKRQRLCPAQQSRARRQ
jgi:polygalacturonase